jgi:hypothetical protein
MRYGRGSYPLTYKIKKSNSQLDQNGHQSEEIDELNCSQKTDEE